MAETKGKEMALTGGFSLQPKTLEEAIKFAELMAKSDLVPKDFVGKPGNVLVAVQMGAELGLPPMQAIQSIAVINGRPAIWGDGLLAVGQSKPAYESHRETQDPAGQWAEITVKRKGSEPHTVRFTAEMAKKAGLWGKQGPWTNYPTRMLQMRARSWALRDKFADVLKGISD